MREAVQRIYRERKALVAGLKVINTVEANQTKLHSGLVFFFSGCWFDSCQTGCRAAMRSPGHHYLFVPPYFQSIKHPGFFGSVCHCGSWVFLHFWEFCPNPL